MPWNDQSGGASGGSGGDGKGPSGGPWGGGPRRPWGQPPRSPQGGQGPDLEDLLRQWRERLRMGGGGGGGGSSGGGGARRGISWPLIAAILAGGWILTGVYSVDEGERGIITTLGKYTTTTEPGLHMHAPVPFQAHEVINVTGQRTHDIGAEDNPSESLMITGDRNIVDVQFKINYNVANVEFFRFRVKDTDGAVRAVAESAMREVIGRRQLEPITTTDRGAVEDEVRQLTQQVLNEYEAGVNVMQVQLIRSQVPPVVMEAFNDVIIARSDAETAANNANRETSRILNEAQGYRERVVREATGEAERFISVHGEYRQSPQVTRDRLYLETMERVYRTGNLVIMDQRAGAVPYLPLDGMLRRNQPPATAQTEQGGR
jgi:modulator of FtsH protease HflK